VRSGGVNDPQAEHPSFDPTIKYAPDIARVDVSYDEAGAVTAIVRVYEAPGTGQTSDNLDLYIDIDQCWGWPQDSDGAPTLTVSFNRGISPADGSVYWFSNATVDGIPGSLSSGVTVSPDGRTFSASFTHALLAGRNYQCVQDGLGTGEFSLFYFNGYAPPPPPPDPPPPPPPPPPVKLNTTTATAAANSYLATRYRTWATSSRKWLRCPREEIFRLDGTRVALCEFELHQGGGRYVGGGFTVALVRGTLKIRHPWTLRYTKTLGRCRLKKTASGWVNGVHLYGRKLRSSRMVGCDSLMVGDIDAEIARVRPRTLGRKHTVGFHGTNRAGFQARSRFTCKVRSRRHGSARRYTLRCQNRLHDKFTYTFTAARR
jgi:hypothetical protein